MSVSADKLAETIAMMERRDEAFQVIDEAICHDKDQVPHIPLTAVSLLLEREGGAERLQSAISRAQITIRKSGHRIEDHFRDGTVFEAPGETFLTVYSTLLIIINASPESDLVAKAQDFFAAKSIVEIAEEERRLRNRFEVNEENKRLSSIAKQAGVQNYGKFTNYGYRGMYGGLVLAEVAREKGLANPSSLLDFAGSEELAAHLFRITQTQAKLKRDKVKTENTACVAHFSVGKQVREAIRKIGGTMPERLPLAPDRIGEVNARTKRRLRKSN